MFISSLSRQLRNLVRGKRVKSSAVSIRNPALRALSFEVRIPSAGGQFLVALYPLLLIAMLYIASAFSYGLIAGYLDGRTEMLKQVEYLELPGRLGSMPRIQLYRPYDISPVSSELSLLSGSLTAFVLAWLLWVWILTKAIRWFRSIRRLSATPVSQLADSRPPILLLRSFSAEMDENADRLDQNTPEELLVAVLGKKGPVLTVGVPGEEGMPVLGATRIYMDENWKNDILRLFSISAVVVIEASTTGGVLWELQNVRSTTSPRKVLISFFTQQESPDYEIDPLFPARGFEKFYAKFGPIFREAIGSELPDYKTDTYLICFDDDWTPYPIRLQTTSNRSIFKFRAGDRRPRKYLSSATIHKGVSSFLRNIDIDTEQLTRRTNT